MFGFCTSDETHDLVLAKAGAYDTKLQPWEVVFLNKRSFIAHGSLVLTVTCLDPLSHNIKNKNAADEKHSVSTNSSKGFVFLYASSHLGFPICLDIIVLFSSILIVFEIEFNTNIILIGAI